MLFSANPRQNTTPDGEFDKIKKRLHVGDKRLIVALDWFGEVIQETRSTTTAALLRKVNIFMTWWKTPVLQVNKGNEAVNVFNQLKWLSDSQRVYCVYFSSTQDEMKQTAAVKVFTGLTPSD